MQCRALEVSGRATFLGARHGKSLVDDVFFKEKSPAIPYFSF